MKINFIRSKQFLLDIQKEDNILKFDKGILAFYDSPNRKIKFRTGPLNPDSENNISLDYTLNNEKKEKLVLIKENEDGDFDKIRNIFEINLSSIPIYDVTEVSVDYLNPVPGNLFKYINSEDTITVKNDNSSEYLVKIITQEINSEYQLINNEIGEVLGGQSFDISGDILSNFLYFIKNRGIRYLDNNNLSLNIKTSIKYNNPIKAKIIGDLDKDTEFLLSPGNNLGSSLYKDVAVNEDSLISKDSYYKYINTEGIKTPGDAEVFEDGSGKFQTRPYRFRSYSNLTLDPGDWKPYYYGVKKNGSEIVKNLSLGPDFISDGYFRKYESPIFNKEGEGQILLESSNNSNNSNENSLGNIDIVEIGTLSTQSTSTNNIGESNKEEVPDYITGEDYIGNGKNYITPDTIIFGGNKKKEGYYLYFTKPADKNQKSFRNLVISGTPNAELEFLFNSGTVDEKTISITVGEDGTGKVDEKQIEELPYIHLNCVTAKSPCFIYSITFDLCTNLGYSLIEDPETASYVVNVVTGYNNDGKFSPTIYLNGFSDYTEYEVYRGEITEVGKGRVSINSIPELEIIELDRKGLYYNIDYSTKSIVVNSSTYSDDYYPRALFQLQINNNRLVNLDTGEITLNNLKTDKFMVVQKGLGNIWKLSPSDFIENKINLYRLGSLKDNSRIFEIYTDVEIDLSLLRFEEEESQNVYTIGTLLLLDKYYDVDTGLLLNRIRVTLISINDNSSSSWIPKKSGTNDPILVTPIYNNVNINSCRFYVAQAAERSEDYKNFSIFYYDTNENKLKLAKKDSSDIRRFVLELPGVRGGNVKTAIITNSKDFINNDKPWTYGSSMGNSFLLKSSNKYSAIGNEVSGGIVGYYNYPPIILQEGYYIEDTSGIKNSCYVYIHNNSISPDITDLGILTAYIGNIDTHNWRIVLESSTYIECLITTAANKLEISDDGGDNWSIVTNQTELNIDKIEVYSYKLKYNKQYTLTVDEDNENICFITEDIERVTSITLPIEEDSLEFETTINILVKEIKDDNIEELGTISVYLGEIDTDLNINIKKHNLSISHSKYGDNKIYYIDYRNDFTLLDLKFISTTTPSWTWQITEEETEEVEETEEENNVTTDITNSATTEIELEDGEITEGKEYYAKYKNHKSGFLFEPILEGEQLLPPFNYAVINYPISEYDIFSEKSLSYYETELEYYIIKKGYIHEYFYNKSYLNIITDNTIDYREEYFCIRNFGSNDITVEIIAAADDGIEYSYDKTEWHSYENPIIINKRNGLFCFFKGTLKNNSNNNRINISGEKAFIDGNIMSLVNGDNFRNNSEFASNNKNSLTRLFYNSPSLANAQNLILPATTNLDYYQMFRGCTSLVKAPELPATTLTPYCYQYMFLGCTSLKTAPELPATTLEPYCYRAMFEDCTSLETAPAELPATTVYEGCYQSMFKGCTSLIVAPELPATTLAKYCYMSMFYGCTNLNYIKCLATVIDNSTQYNTSDWVRDVSGSGKFYGKPNANWTRGVNGYPKGWSFIDSDSNSTPHFIASSIQTGGVGDDYAITNETVGGHDRFDKNTGAHQEDLIIIPTGGSGGGGGGGTSSSGTSSGGTSSSGTTSSGGTSSSGTTSSGGATLLPLSDLELIDYVNTVTDSDDYFYDITLTDEKISCRYNDGDCGIFYEDKEEKLISFTDKYFNIYKLKFTQLNEDPSEPVNESSPNNEKNLKLKGCFYNTGHSKSGDFFILGRIESSPKFNIGNVGFNAVTTYEELSADDDNGLFSGNAKTLISGIAGENYNKYCKENVLGEMINTLEIPITLKIGNDNNSVLPSTPEYFGGLTYVNDSGIQEDEINYTNPPLPAKKTEKSIVFLYNGIIYYAIDNTAGKPEINPVISFKKEDEKIFVNNGLNSISYTVNSILTKIFNTDTNKNIGAGIWALVDNSISIIDGYLTYNYKTNRSLSLSLYNNSDEIIKINGENKILFQNIKQCGYRYHINLIITDNNENKHTFRGIGEALSDYVLTDEGRPNTAEEYNRPGYNKLCPGGLFNDGISKYSYNSMIFPLSLLSRTADSITHPGFIEYCEFKLGAHCYYTIEGTSSSDKYLRILTNISVTTKDDIYIDSTSQIGVNNGKLIRIYFKTPDQNTKYYRINLVLGKEDWEIQNYYPTSLNIDFYDDRE